jgi:hypothetical protein
MWWKPPNIKEIPMSKKTVGLIIALVGILLLSTLIFSKTLRSHFSSMVSSTDDSDDMF